MPREELEQLFVFLVPSLVVFAGVRSGRLPYLRFRRPAALTEPPLWGWLDSLLVFCFWLLTQILLGAVLLPLVDAKLLNEAQVFAVSQIGTALLVSWVLLRVLRLRLGQPLATLGLRSTSWSNVLPTVLLCGASLVPIGSVQILWNLLLGHLFEYRPSRQQLVDMFGGYVRESDWGSVALFVVMGVVTAPLVEETLFRGFIYGSLRFRFGIVIGAFVSSLLFAFVHGSLSAFLALFILGCLLCDLYEATGSLYPPIIFHAAFNGIMFLNLFLQRTT